MFTPNTLYYKPTQLKGIAKWRKGWKEICQHKQKIRIKKSGHIPLSQKTIKQINLT